MDRMSNIFSLDELKNNIQELSKNIITSYLYEEGGGGLKSNPSEKSEF